MSVRSIAVQAGQHPATILLWVWYHDYILPAAPS